ncbi:MAG: sugar phosphate isomerase/epimerase family protein [Thermoguttaceae bacterium]
MARLSISETTTFRWSLEDDVTHYSAAGIPAVGVWRHKLSDCGLPAARTFLRDAGLKVSHLSWAGGFTGSDGRSHRESIDDAADAIRTAGELECPTLVVYSGSRGGHTVRHARRLFQEALAELAPLADEQRVTLAVKPMHPGCAAEWTFLTSLDDTLALLAAVGHPRVKMVLDTYHLGFAGPTDHLPRQVDNLPHDADDLPQKVAEAAPQVALVQLGDARRPPNGEQNRCRLGEGVVPLRPIVAALQAAGYDGDYDVELLGEEFESADYCTLLEHAKTAFRSLVE